MLNGLLPNINLHGSVVSRRNDLRPVRRERYRPHNAIMTVHRLRRLSLLQRPHNHLLIRRTTSQALPSPTWTPSTSHQRRCPPPSRTLCVPAANRPARSSPFCSHGTRRFRRRSPRRAAWTRRKRACEWASRGLRSQNEQKSEANRAECAARAVWRGREA